MPNIIRVLIADDNRNFTAILCDYFNLYLSMEVVGIAGNGSETIEMLRLFKPDVLLLDIVMPDMDGIEILHSIKEFAYKPIVIILSAIENKDVIDMCFSLGVSHYFIKPLNLEIVRQKIRSLMENKAAIKNPPYKPNGLYKVSIEIEEKITGLLLSCGIPASILGFRFARDIIALFIQKKGKGSIADLYTIIAQHYKTTTIRVIKAINYAIKVAWERSSFSNQSEMMKIFINKNNMRPNNSQFVRALSGRLTKELNSDDHAAI